MLFGMMGLAWLTVGGFAMGGYDYFLFSNRPPHTSDLFQVISLAPGILALLVSAGIRLTRSERSDLET